MPLWKVYHTHDAIPTLDVKEAIAKGATALYVAKDMPDFYVHVIFFPLPEENIFTAGIPQGQFVGVEIVHVARQWDGNMENATNFKDAVDKIMKPHTTDKGIHFEFCVVQGPAALWRIDGIDPPEAFGPEELGRAAENKRILSEKYGTTA